MATEDPALTADEQAKLKAFAQGLPDEPGDIDVDKIAQQTGTSRRQVLQVIAAVGVGSIAGGVSVSQLVSEAKAQASTSDSDGNVGTPSDRVDVFSDGIDSNTIDTDKVSNSKRFILATDDFQSRLDTIARRAGLFIPEFVTHELNGPIYLGQNTTIQGGNGDLVDQPESGSWDYSPYPVLDFSSAAQTGVESDPNATYRVHHPLLRDLTIVGSGFNNGATGVLMSTNANGTKTGFFELENVFVEDYETAVDGGGTADGARLEKCHARNCTNGVVGVATEAWIRGCTFWHFEGNGTAVEISGARSVVSETEFEMGGGGGASNVDGVVVNGEKVNVTDNHFKTPHGRSVHFNNAGIGRVTDNTFEGSVDYSVYLSSSGSNVIIADNTFDMPSFNSNVIYSEASATLIANNDFRHLQYSGAQDSTKDLISLNQNRAIVIGNNMPNGGFNSDVVVNSGANDCFLIGWFPNGVIDNGSKTVINGHGTNAGDPSSGGQWNGFAQRAHHLGVTVWDTSTTPATPYKADPNGNWVAI